MLLGKSINFNILIIKLCTKIIEDFASTDKYFLAKNHSTLKVSSADISTEASFLPTCRPTSTQEQMESPWGSHVPEPGDASADAIKRGTITNWWGRFRLDLAKEGISSINCRILILTKHVPKRSLRECSKLQNDCFLWILWVKIIFCCNCWLAR